jgi:hypothetical protein
MTMTPEQMESRLKRVFVRTMALREVVAILLADAASRRDDPEDFLRLVSQATDKRIDRNSPERPIHLQALEDVRHELDQIVQFAQAILKAPPPDEDS